MYTPEMTDVFVSNATPEGSSGWIEKDSANELGMQRIIGKASPL